MNFSGIKKSLSKTIQSVSSNKFLNNEILYKVVVALAILNVISYIVSKNINAFIVFTLVYLATNYLTKNMTIVLLSAIFVTNFLIVSKKIKENLENKETEDNDKPEDNENTEDNDDISDNSTIPNINSKVEQKKNRRKNKGKI